MTVLNLCDHLLWLSTTVSTLILTKGVTKVRNVQILHIGALKSGLVNQSIQNAVKIEMSLYRKTEEDYVTLDSLHLIF